MIQDLTIRMGADGAAQTGQAIAGVAQSMSDLAKGADGLAGAAQAAGSSLADLVVSATPIGQIVGGLQAMASGQILGGISALAGGLGGIKDAVAGAAGALFSLAQSGQVANEVASSFERLGGTASDMERLRESTASLVDDTSLQTVANRAMAAGISIAEIAPMLEVATGAATLAGTDVQAATDAVLQSVISLNERGLKGLGISIDDLEGQYASYAQSIGKTTKELTDAEKRHVMMNAVMAQSGAQMAAAEAARANSIGQTTAALANLQSSLEEVVAGAIASSGILDVVMDGIGMLGDLLYELQPALEDIASAAGELLAGLMPAFSDLTKSIGPLVGLIARLASAIIKAVSDSGLLTAALKVVEGAVFVLTPLIGGLAIIVEGLGGKVASVAGAMDTLFSSTPRNARVAGDAFRSLADEMERMKSEARAAALAVDSVADSARGVVAANASMAASNREVATTFRELNAAREQGGRFQDVRARDQLSDLAGLLAVAEKEGGIWEAAINLAQARGGSAQEKAMLVRLLGSEVTAVAGIADDVIAAFDAARAQADAVVQAGMERDIRQRDFLAGFSASRHTEKTLEELAALNEQLEGASAAVDQAAAAMVSQRMGIDADTVTALVQFRQKATGEMLADAGRELQDQQGLELMLMSQREVLIQQDREIAEERQAAARAAEESAKAGAAARQRQAEEEKRNHDAAMKLQREIYLGSLFGHDRRLFLIEEELQANLRAVGQVAEGREAAIQIANEKVAESLAEQQASLDALVAGATHIWNLFGDAAEKNVKRMEDAITDTPERYRERLVENLTAASEAIREHGAVWGDFMAQLETQMGPHEEAVLGGLDGIGKMMTALQESMAAGATEMEMGLAVGQQATLAFVKHQAAQATILGLMESAKAIAAFANPWAAAAHGLAALKFFAVAAMGGKGGKGGGGASRPPQRAERAPREPRAKADQQAVTNQYFFSSLDRRPPGVVVADALNETASDRRGVRLDGSLFSSDDFVGGR